MNRTIKDATVRRYYYDYGRHDPFRQQLADLVATSNLARHLKTLRGLTLSETICKAWTHEPFGFTYNPHH